MVKGAGSGEVELFAWARGCGAWRLGRVAEVPEDLAHGDWVCDLCDEAAWTAAMRAGEDVEGEDAAQELGPSRAAGVGAGGGAGRGR